MLGKHWVTKFQPNPRQQNFEGQPQRAWRRGGGGGSLSAAVMPLLKGGEKLNRKGSRGNREQMLQGRHPGLSGWPCTVTKGKQSGKDGSRGDTDG